MERILKNQKSVVHSGNFQKSNFLKIDHLQITLAKLISQMVP